MANNRSLGELRASYADHPPSQWTRGGSEMSLWDMIRVPFRYWFRTSFCFVALMAVVVAVTAMTPKQYQSEAKLLVRLGRENMGLDPTATMGNSQNINVTQTRQAEINSVATILGNRSLAERVVDRVGVDRILEQAEGSAAEPSSQGEIPESLAGLAGDLMPSMNLDPREKAVRLLQKEVEVEAGSDSNLVSVRFASHQPELSRDVVATLVDLYLDEHVALHRNLGTYEFLQHEKEDVHLQLRDTEEKLRKLKSETGLISPAEQRATLVAQIGRLRDQHIDVKAQIAELDAEAGMLREKLSGLSETLVLEETQGAANFASDGMREQLYALQLTEKRLLASHTEEHPEVKRIRTQIESAEKILAGEQEHRTEVTTGPNRVYDETHLQLIRKEPSLHGLQVKDEKLSSLLAEFEKELQELNNNELEIARLTREIEIQETNYRKYAMDTEQARIDQSLLDARLSNIAVAQQATLDPYPAYPKTKVNLLLGFVFAFCASCGLAFLSDSYDRWRRSSREIPAELSRHAMALRRDHEDADDQHEAEAEIESVDDEADQEAEPLTPVAARPR